MYTSKVLELTSVSLDQETQLRLGKMFLSKVALLLQRRTNFFGSLFKTILKIIAIVLIIIAIVYGFYAFLMYMDLVAVTTLPTILVQGAVMVGITNITWYALAAVALLALAVAAIVDLDTVTETLGKIRSAIGSVVDTTVGVVGDTIGSVIEGGSNVISSASSSMIKLALLAGGVVMGWKWLNKPPTPKPVSAPSNTTTES